MIGPRNGVSSYKKKLKRSRKPASFSSRGYGRFLSFSDIGDVAIDEALIKDAAKWDGLHAILIHGADDLDVLDVIARYHQLWEIEACFRTNKHDLKIRPIYHWTPQRVRAHIAICYDLLYGLLLPAAPAQAFEDARPPDESGSHPEGTEHCAGLDPSLQRHTRTLCHVKPRDHRRKTHSDMCWPDLERGSLPDAAGTDAQNRSDQWLKQTIV